MFKKKNEVIAQIENLNKKIRLDGLTENRSSDEIKLTTQLEEWEKREELLWKQKSRIQWLKEGDQNTNFFHNSLLARRSHNFISSLKSDSGDIVYTWDGMSSIVVDYFSNLFTATPVDSASQQNILQAIPSVIAFEENSFLTAPITINELQHILFKMQKWKTLGPNGFPIEFY